MSYGGSSLIVTCAAIGLLLRIHYECNSAQAMLRDILKLNGFVSAEAFLFIGRETETEVIRKKDLKSALNNINSHLQIRSLDALLRRCDRILGSYHKNA